MLYDRTDFVQSYGEELFMDLPNTESVQNWSQAFATHQGNEQIPLPLPPPATVQNSSSTAWRDQPKSFLRKVCRPGRNTGIKASQQGPQPPPGSSSGTMEYRFVHWCVNSRQFEIILNHIHSIKDITKDLDFVHELRKAYRKTRGWRFYLTLNECSGIKLIEFVRNHKTRETIARTLFDIPLDGEHRKDYDFDYDARICREVFIEYLEQTLINRYHYGCDPDSEDLLPQIPKRKQKLEPGFRIVGYGIYAEQGPAFWRFCLALLITQPGPCFFAWYYLQYKQPWDLQTAFTPWFIVSTSLAFVVIRDVKAP
jgi:hypothetical protein